MTFPHWHRKTRDLDGYAEASETVRRGPLGPTLHHYVEDPANPGWCECGHARTAIYHHAPPRIPRWRRFLLRAFAPFPTQPYRRGDE